MESFKRKDHKRPAFGQLRQCFIGFVIHIAIGCSVGGEVIAGPLHTERNPVRLAVDIVVIDDPHHKKMVFPLDQVINSDWVFGFEKATRGFGQNANPTR